MSTMSTKTVYLLLLFDAITNGTLSAHIPSSPDVIPRLLLLLWRFYYIFLFIRHLHTHRVRDKQGCLCESECKSKTKNKIVCSVRQRRLCTWRCDSYEDYARTCAHSVIKGSEIKTHLWVRLSAVRLAQRPDGNSIWIISILLFRFNVLVNHFSYSIIMNFLFGIRRYSEF